eukprot:6442012-Amphidinium_carterae.7
MPESIVACGPLLDGVALDLLWEACCASLVRLFLVIVSVQVFESVIAAQTTVQLCKQSLVIAFDNALWLMAMLCGCLYLEVWQLSSQFV